MRNFFFSMVAMVLTILMAGPALANSVSFEAGTTNDITAVQNYATTGDMMAGMTVQVFFSSGPPETATWAITGSGAGAASGAGWSLAESGDTYGYLSNNWTLTNTGTAAISKIVIDAFPGSTVFDTTFNNLTGTLNSQLGYDFTVLSLSNLNISATYRDLVALQGSNPVGDLYRYLDIVFVDQDFVQGSLTFRADTDNISVEHDFPVPLPGTFFLLGSGLVGLGIMRRKWSLKK